LVKQLSAWEALTEVPSLSSSDNFINTTQPVFPDSPQGPPTPDAPDHDQISDVLGDEQMPHFQDRQPGIGFHGAPISYPRSYIQGYKKIVMDIADNLEHTKRLLSFDSVRSRRFRRLHRRSYISGSKAVHDLRHDGARMVMEDALRAEML
jgi:hypothetical protein